MTRFKHVHALPASPTCGTGPPPGNPSTNPQPATPPQDRIHVAVMFRQAERRGSRRAVRACARKGIHGLRGLTMQNRDLGPAAGDTPSEHVSPSSHCHPDKGFRGLASNVPGRRFASHMPRPHTRPAVQGAAQPGTPPGRARAVAHALLL